MSFSLTFGHTVSGEGVSLSKSAVETAESLIQEEVEVAANTTDQLVAFVLDVSQVKALYLVSDKAVTVETNSSSAAQETIDLEANVPYVWHSKSGLDMPLAGDVTALYITNANAAAATVNIVALVDPTV